MIKLRSYPTTQLLRKSNVAKKRYESEDSAASRNAGSYASSDLQKSGASDSDQSELLVASEQALNPIQTDKLTKVYNQQGHYAIGQAYSALFCCAIKTPGMRNLVNTLLHIGATLVVIANFAILFYWLQYVGPKSTMTGIYELNGQP